MKTGARVFLFSALFGLVVAGIYWAVSYEHAGTALLAFMGAALLVMAGYIAISLRGAEAPAPDRPDARPRDLAGETVGMFPVESPWPPVMAVGVMVGLLGLVFGAPLYIVGAIICALAALGFMRETST
jgi:hypothetical protein